MNTTLNHCSFKLGDVQAFKRKMLNWLTPFGIFCYLDNQGYNVTPQQIECLVAVGVRDFVEGTDVKTAGAFFEKKQWAFGHLAYDLKNSLHRLSSTREDKIDFPPFLFFLAANSFGHKR